MSKAFSISHTELAAALGVSKAAVSQWFGVKWRVPVGRCAAIEAATGRAVMRWDLRPDDWHRIWPELVGAEGAPAVPEHHAASAAA